MNLSDARTLFAYDRWATERIFECVTHLDEASLHRDASSSFSSVFGTLVHIVGAVEVWVDRWESRAGVRLPKEQDFSSLQALRARWTHIAEARDAFVAQLGDGARDETMEIRTLSGETYHHRYKDMFTHLVNHGSYHRGQVVTLLRQLGADVVSTDLIQFHRERQRTTER